jgi:Domain of unknown function (DUF4389)
VDSLSAPERPEVPPGTTPPQGPPSQPPPPGGPLRTANHDDLGRNRLTVFFRLILGIPHLLWLSIWGFGMALLAPVIWIATIVKRRPPDGLHEAFAMYVRYALHVYAYLTFAADLFPGFLGRPGSYPVDVEIPAASKPGRASAAFRLILALPPLALTSTLVGASFSGGTSTDPAEIESFAVNFGTVAAVAFLAWFACLARGRMPLGMRDLLVWALGYATQTYGYLLFLTPRYPNSDPAIAPVRPLPEHPVTMGLTDDLARNRLTVAFRLILAFPHFAWWLVWTLVIFVVAPVLWVWTLAAGRPPSALQRFVVRYLRYGAHLTAFGYLGAGPFPGFVGAPGSYPLDIDLPERPERQSRWVTLFRGFLAFPAFIISSGVGGAMGLAAVGGWFASLATGRMPEGLRNLVAYGTRYGTQVGAYALLVTGRYPYSGPGDFAA